MTIKLLQQSFIEEIISIYEPDEAKELFSLTADHLFGLNRSQLILQAAETVSEAQYLSYMKILSGLKEGRPIQHILGEAWFYGEKFKVNSSVLIPRPETEELVQWILETVSAKRNIKLIDIGTGSGCIAITLKSKLPEVEVEALDVSAEALVVAKENALNKDVNINFIQSDIFGYQSLCSYDLIVSNPPYIREVERSDMHNHVLLHEPSVALFVGDEDPLLFYRCIAEFALKHLEDHGYLFFEINEYLGKETIDMLTEKGFENIELKTDMQGKERMIRCQLN